MTKDAAERGTDRKASGRTNFVRWLQVSVWMVLLACSALYVVFTWHWPLVGDSSLIHYIAFLMDRGWAPYRDLGDMNLPGSYLIEWTAMHVFGGGSLAWRLFDLSVLGAIAAGYLLIAGRGNRLAGVWATVLFAAIHGRDGINNTGQRDLVMAALVVLGYAFLFRCRRKGSILSAFLFGFAMAAAGTIKPTALPLGLLLLAMLWIALRRERRPVAGPITLAVAGFLIPPLICLVFLVREHAIGAFIHSLRTVVPWFASLGRRPVGYLLVHSVSPLMALVAVWVVLMLWTRMANGGAHEPHEKNWGQRGETRRWEQAALLLGAAAMLAGFVVQGKGFPYHRYPFLALLLPVMALDLTRALRRRGISLALGVMGLAWGAFVVVPQSVAAVHRYDWRNQELIEMIQSDLSRLGGPALSGRVQCIDTISGCTTALYHLRLEPATGLLSDFLVYGPETNEAVRDARSAFWSRIAQHPPEVIVITANLFPSGPNDFQKLAMWPRFEELLATRYRLCVQRTPTRPVLWWSRPEIPPAYRIYVISDCLASGAGCALPPSACKP